MIYAGVNFFRREPAFIIGLIGSILTGLFLDTEWNFPTEIEPISYLNGPVSDAIILIPVLVGLTIRRYVTPTAQPLINHRAKRGGEHEEGSRRTA